ncbi:MAG: hypothetical protein UHH95_00300 [Oscillospiraceae bacterium]|nr:hypothetical protein [Oscillospiraceae bacterium]
MDEYKKPYLILFNAISDAKKSLMENNMTKAMEILDIAQMKAEEAFISFEEQENM